MRWVEVCEKGIRNAWLEKLVRKMPLAKPSREGHLPSTKHTSLCVSVHKHQIATEIEILINQFSPKYLIENNKRINFQVQILFGIISMQKIFKNMLPDKT
jgi:hypothetical protein